MSELIRVRRYSGALSQAWRYSGFMIRVAREFVTAVSVFFRVDRTTVTVDSTTIRADRRTE